MSDNAVALKGQWEKTSPSRCAEQYPDRLEFRDGGLYFGHKDPAGTFTQWDVGTWEMAGSNQIKLSTANDAVISYEWSLSGDLLTFKDAEGCEFQYRKRS